MGRTELFAHFAERFGIRRADAREFFDELQQLTEQELAVRRVRASGGREAGGAEAGTADGPPPGDWSAG